MSATLKGQRAVVFGGASGAGLAAAKLLASSGAEVIIGGRGVEKPEVDGLRAYAVDGKDASAVAAFFEKVGTFQHLVITAGATSRGKPFAEISIDAIRDSFEGKFWVQVTAAHEAVRFLEKGGSITFFSGGANRRALPSMVNIAAVNAALDGIVPTLARELAPTRVNAISPGTLKTSYWTGVPDDAQAAIFDRTAKALPAGRVGTAEDVAQAVLFLVTTSFVTGTVLHVDGGLPHSSL
jgi:NAD(P)-dependent dehydrogenase (short-subunit alcohol dehydrogenase family)